jgi:hypothetical protein
MRGGKPQLLFFWWMCETTTRRQETEIDPGISVARKSSTMGGTPQFVSTPILRKTNSSSNKLLLSEDKNRE